MKKLIVLLLLFVLSFALMACSSKDIVEEPTPVPETEEDWEPARQAFVRELTNALAEIAEADSSKYSRVRQEWMTKVEPAVYGRMFPEQSTSDGFLGSASYRGYSAPEFNSDGMEYVLFSITRLEIESMNSTSWDVLITLSRDPTLGYIVSGYERTLVG